VTEEIALPIEKYGIFKQRSMLHNCTQLPTTSGNAEIQIATIPMATDYFGDSWLEEGETIKQAMECFDCVMYLASANGRNKIHVRHKNHGRSFSLSKNNPERFRAIEFVDKDALKWVVINYNEATWRFSNDFAMQGDGIDAHGSGYIGNDYLDDYDPIDPGKLHEVFVRGIHWYNSQSFKTGGAGFLTLFNTSLSYDIPGGGKANAEAKTISGLIDELHAMWQHLQNPETGGYVIDQRWKDATHFVTDDSHGHIDVFNLYSVGGVEITFKRWFWMELHRNLNVMQSLGLQASSASGGNPYAIIPMGYSGGSGNYESYVANGDGGRAARAAQRAYAVIDAYRDMAIGSKMPQDKVEELLEGYETCRGIWAASPNYANPYVFVGTTFGDYDYDQLSKAGVGRVNIMNLFAGGTINSVLRRFNDAVGGSSDWGNTWGPVESNDATIAHIRNNQAVKSDYVAFYNQYLSQTKLALVQLWRKLSENIGAIDAAISDLNADPRIEASDPVFDELRELRRIHQSFMNRASDYYDTMAKQGDPVIDGSATGRNSVIRRDGARIIGTNVSISEFNRNLGEILFQLREAPVSLRPNLYSLAKAISDFDYQRIYVLLNEYRKDFNVLDIEAISHMLIAVTKEDRIYYSLPGTFEIESLNFYSAEYANSSPVQSWRLANRLVLMTNNTVEFWDVTNDVEDPLSPAYSSNVYSLQSVAKSIVRYNDALYFIARPVEMDTYGLFSLTKNGQLENISYPQLETWINEQLFAESPYRGFYDDGVIGSAICIENVPFIMWHLKKGVSCLAYNIVFKTFCWNDNLFFLVDGNYWHFGGRAIGRLDKYFDDDTGYSIPCKIVAANTNFDGKKRNVKALEVDADLEEGRRDRRENILSNPLDTQSAGINGAVPPIMLDEKRERFMAFNFDRVSKMPWTSMRKVILKPMQGSRNVNFKVFGIGIGTDFQFEAMWNGYLRINKLKLEIE